MNLAEFQKFHGIKRIDFDKLHRTDVEEQCDTDRLICPYCGEVIEYESEDIDDILGGTPMRCPECEKWFWAGGEISVNTTCTPMEDAVLDHINHIEHMYEYMDKCDEHGLELPESRYGIVEWDIYATYAKPLFENQKMEGER